MNKLNFLFIAGILLFGAFLLGGGITGMVVSQSCCFPPNCNIENMCAFAESASSISADSAIVYMFVFAAISGMLIFHLVNRS